MTHSRDMTDLVWFEFIASVGLTLLYSCEKCIGCCAVYLTLILCVMVDTTTLRQKCSKESQHFSLSRTTICLSGRPPTDRKIWSVCHWRSRKFKLRTLKWPNPPIFFAKSNLLVIWSIWGQNFLNLLESLIFYALSKSRLKCCTTEF